MALATLVVDSVISEPDPLRAAKMYLDGLTPPEWSACGRFLKEGLAEGDFYDIDIRIEIAPNMTTALQWLVDNIPLEAWRRWGEIFTEHPEYHPEYQVYLDMDRWLEGLEKCSGLSSAICYIEMHPPHFWSLGWIFDRELFRCLAVKVAFCEEVRELERIIDALDVPFAESVDSWMEWSAMRRRAFLVLCEPEVMPAPDPDELAWAEAIRDTARVVSASASGNGASRAVTAASGSGSGQIGRPTSRRKALKLLGVAFLLLVIAVAVSAGYARWDEEREREEHEAYMASLERLDRSELETAIAANAEINKEFIKAELADSGRADALTEDVEILSIDLEDGELISGFANATCTVRGLESGTVYEVDLGLRDDGVVEYVFGSMAVDEHGAFGKDGDRVG